MLRERSFFTLSGSLAILSLIVTGLSAQSFEEGFDQQDGPAEDLTVHSGTWEVRGEVLTGASAGETWAWLGSPAIEFPPIYELSFDMEFINRPGDGIGRHGGIMFCATIPTQRYDPGISGYELDWIDRESDHGLRLIRVDNGQHTMIGTGAANLPDPPLEWEVIVEAAMIQIWGDGELLIEVADDLHRGGHLGLWAWSNGQLVGYDNIAVESPETSVCFRQDPRSGGAPLEVNFDASCTISDAGIESYEWDFGDGQGAEGEQVTHIYDLPDTYVVTLTATDANGDAHFSESTVTVFEVVNNYEESFDQDDGQAEGWTVYSGDWQVVNGALNGTSAGEIWSWAGNPPLRFPSTYELFFDMEFLSQPADLVGRHGGIMFCATIPTQRWEPGISGYELDWIDRPEDHGLRLLRVDSGEHTFIASGASDLPDPPTEWQISIDEETIQVWGDGELLIEAQDGTHRSGHIGCWAYLNDQSVSFDNFLLESGGAENCTNDRDDDGDGDVDCDDEDCMDRGICLPAELCDNGIDDDRDGAADCDDSDCSETEICVAPAGPRLVRGDANSDGSINLTDGVIPLLYLFSGGAEPACMDSADTNDTGAIEITDAIIVFGWLFSGGSAPAPPSPTSAGYLATDCGEDPTIDDLGCASEAVLCE
jgi:PKD repeat protein